MGTKNILKVNKKDFKAGDDFFPLAYSANKVFDGKSIMTGYGISAPGRNDYEGLKNLTGKVFVMEVGYPTRYGRTLENGRIRRP